MTAFAGFGGRITVGTGATVLRGYRWVVDWKADDFDVSCFENNAYGNYIAGLIDADVTIDAYWDTIDNPFAAPMSIAPGANIGPLTILYTKSNGVSQLWNFANFLVVDVHNETNMHDVVRYTFHGKYFGTVPGTVTPTIPVN